MDRHDGDPMESKQMIVIIAVVVVVIAAVGAYFAFSGGEDEPGEVDDGRDSLTITEYPSRLLVLGNTNCDDYLNTSDISYLEGVIEDADGGVVDYQTNYMCDANYDGVVDSADVDYLTAMVNENWGDGDGDVRYVHYVNVDLEVASYEMTTEKWVITIISPPLDDMLILNPDLVIGFDNRITTNQRSPYEAIYDIDSMYDVGLAATPDVETIVAAADSKNGDVTVFIGSKMYYGGTLETDLADYPGIQIVRLPTWEVGDSIEGLLTIGFLLGESENAYAYLEWYEGVCELVQDTVATVPESERPAVAVFYPHRGSTGGELLGPMSGEVQNLALLGIVDVGTEYFDDIGMSTQSDRVDMTYEVLATLIDDYDLDVLIGAVGAPFQVNEDSTGQMQGTIAGMQYYYEFWEDRISDLLPSLDDYCVTGFTFLSGISECVGQLLMGYYLYPDYFSEEMVIEVVNELCDIMGIGDVWNFDSMNLIYDPGDPREILNGA